MARTVDLSDIIGMKVNGIEVLEYKYFKYHGIVQTHRVYIYDCKCHCGKIVEMQRLSLKKGVVKSCGCIPAYYKHGDTHTKLYKTWVGMINRTTKNYMASYKHYGGRGISVCERWMAYVNFKEDMEDEFNHHIELHGIKDTSLDRIDVNGNYCPENCRWATMKVQGNNVRHNVYLTYNGETNTIAVMADKYEIPYGVLHNRIFHHGWSVDKAFEKPVHKRSSKSKNTKPL